MNVTAWDKYQETCELIKDEHKKTAELLRAKLEKAHAKYQLALLVADNKYHKDRAVEDAGKAIAIK